MLIAHREQLLGSRLVLVRTGNRSHLSCQRQSRSRQRKKTRRSELCVYMDRGHTIDLHVLYHTKDNFVAV